jgi:hypothetical protein
LALRAEARELLAPVYGWFTAIILVLFVVEFRHSDDRDRKLYAERGGRRSSSKPINGALSHRARETLQRRRGAVGEGAALTPRICGALEALTRALAIELAPIRVNAVCPGVVKTELWSDMPESDRQLCGSASDRGPSAAC